MKNRISALIIDPLKNEHNYDLRYEHTFDHCERGFDLTIIENSDNINKILSNDRGFDCILTIGENINFEPLNNLPFELRKKWIHTDNFNGPDISTAIVNVFTNNINRTTPQNVELFSIFTCVYNTPKEYIERLYNSLLKQTYTEWNWWIIDDSTNPSAEVYLKDLNDPRIFIIKNTTNHGVIGFNKHMIGMACNGKYLVEVDHDDELTENCLELLHNAFIKYPEVDFVYSDTLEICDNEEIIYGDGFSFGQGTYRKEYVYGKERTICVTTPSINCKSIRGIYAEPNHVRCWKSEFYHKIGGHNIELSVLDDMDLMIRTFLYGKMAHIPKVLYIQHEDIDRSNGNGENTQSKRFKEIQRTNWLLYNKYDEEIHKRILELGYVDQIWDEATNTSILSMEIPLESLIPMNETL